MIVRGMAGKGVLQIHSPDIHYVRPQARIEGVLLENRKDFPRRLLLVR